MLNIEEIKKHIEYFRKDKYDREFYVALLIYDVLGYNEKEVTEEIINRVYDIEDQYESIHKSELRDELRNELEMEQEEEIEI